MVSRHEFCQLSLCVGCVLAVGVSNCFMGLPLMWYDLYVVVVVSSMLNLGRKPSYVAMQVFCGYCGRVY